MIEFRDVSKSYNKPLFEKFNLRIEQGEFVLISGASGSGKSTLLNMLGMLDDDYQGEIEILGHTNTRLTSAKGQKLLKNDLSYLFQNYGLIDNQTVFENLKLVYKLRKNRKNKQIDLITAVLDKLNLDVDLDTPIYQLSGGEQQRVAIAKILLKTPKIILCDEPTGSLDANNTKVILEILRELNLQGCTIVIVSHESIVERYVDRTIKL